MPLHTPWKKSRKFGDVYGGRKRTKFADNIFKRCHSIKRPNPNDTLPILMVDNPSRDFFFPLSGEEVLEALRELPKKDFDGVTHVWLRRAKKSDYVQNKLPFAWFTCGSGVRAIVIFAWPNDLTLSYGRKKPSNRIINELNRFGVKLEKVGKEWISKWTIEAVRKFYIYILYHEVGHHIDWYFRHLSRANTKAAEEYAEQYAMVKTATATHVYNRMKKKMGEDP